MWTRIQRLAGWLLILLAAGHTFVGTPMFYDEFSQGVIWYVGTGLAIFCVGALNLAQAAGLPRPFHWAVLLFNVAWLALALALLTTSQHWQVITAVVLAATATLCSVIAGRVSRQ